jgi:hypothetical protein
MQSISRKRQALGREEAEELAIAVLGFLAGEEHRLASFLVATGLSPDDLRRQMGSVELLAGVLDFIAADESLLLVFAAERRIDPAAVMTARHVLLPEATDY